MILLIGLIRDPAGTVDGNISSRITIRLINVSSLPIDQNKATKTAYVRGDGVCIAPNSNA
ncbi:MAG: hypothetical protein OXC62_01060 [Aestuariivita sp.]|nr:hypothetical protein [Aestuariivita sp.]